MKTKVETKTHDFEAGWPRQNKWERVPAVRASLYFAKLFAYFSAIGKVGNPIIKHGKIASA